MEKYNIWNNTLEEQKLARKKLKENHANKYKFLFSTVLLKYA